MCTSPLSADEAAPGVLRKVLCSSVQERRGATVERPEKGHKRFVFLTKDENLADMLVPKQAIKRRKTSILRLDDCFSLALAVQNHLSEKIM